MTDTARLRQVTWFEVLFDLVAVGAIVQTGGIVADDTSIGGLARTTLIVLILWWHWTGATLSFRRYVSGSPAASVLVAVQIVALLVVGVAVPTATGTTADTFVWALVAARLALLGIYLVAEPETGPSRRMVDRYVVFGLLGVVLLALSTALSGSLQQAVWGLALLVSVGGAVTSDGGQGHGHPSHRRPHAGEHMVERYALFTVLMLGGAAYAAVVVLSGQGFTGSTVAVTCFLGIAVLALWLLYLPASAGSVRSSPASVYVWSLAHLAVALGLVLLAAALGRTGLLELSADVVGPVVLTLGAALALALLGVAVIRVVTAVGAGTTNVVAAACGVLAGCLALAGLVGLDLDLRVLLVASSALVAAPVVAELARPRA